MSSNAIASGSAILTANADGLAAGLDKGAKAVQTWGTKVAATINSTFKGGTLGGFQNIGSAAVGQLAGLANAAKSALSGAGLAIGTMIGGPIGGAIGSAVGSAVGELGTVAVGALAAPFEKLNKFSDIHFQSKSLGVSASQFAGLSVVMEKAGIDGAHVAQTFAVMGKQISDVAAGKGKGAALAFQTLGLNAAELVNLKPDQQLLKIADAFHNMPAGADQASAAVHLFGGNAAGMLKELSKGSGSIQGLVDSMKKTGAVLSDDQYAAAGAASRAWKDAKVSIKSAWDGLANRATMLAAPVIGFVGKAVTKVFAMAAPVFEWVGRAIGKVGDIVTAIFEQLMKWFDEGVAAVKAFGAEFLNFGGQMPTVEDVVVSVFRAIGTVVALAWDTFKLGPGVMAVVTGAILENGATILGVFRQITDLAKDLPADMRPEWVDGMVNGIAKADDAVKAFGGKLKNWGKDAVTSWGEGPANFNRWLDKALVKKGKLDEVKLNADGTPAEGATGGPLKLAGALAKGSKEAYSMVLKNQLAGMFGDRGDLPKQQLKEAQKGNKIGEKQLGEQKKTNDKLGALGVT